MFSSHTSVQLEAVAPGTKGSLGSSLCPPPQGPALPPPARMPWAGLPGTLACGQRVRRAAPGVECGWQASSPGVTGGLGRGPPGPPYPHPSVSLYPLTWPQSKALPRIPKCPLCRQGNRGSESAQGLPFPPQPKIPPQTKNKQKNPPCLPWLLLSLDSSNFPQR